MGPADDAHVGREACGRHDFGRERSERVPGVAGRREQSTPAELVDHAREVALLRAPKIGVRAHRGALGRRNAAQAPRPILRVGQERARRRELSRESPLKIVDLSAEIEPARQVGRQRFLKWRPQLVIFRRDGAVDVELIVHGRQRGVLVPDQHARRAMRRDRNRFDRELSAEFAQRADEERPGPFGVKPPVRPASVRRDRCVAMAALGHDLARVVEHDDLHIGLAEVEHGDAFIHRASPVHSR